MGSARVLNLLMLLSLETLLKSRPFRAGKWVLKTLVGKKSRQGAAGVEEAGRWRGWGQGRWCQMVEWLLGRPRTTTVRGVPSPFASVLLL